MCGVVQERQRSLERENVVYKFNTFLNTQFFHRFQDKQMFINSPFILHGITIVIFFIAWKKCRRLGNKIENYDRLVFIITVT